MRKHSSGNALFIGIDIGTSGCRAIAIDRDGREHANVRVPLPDPKRFGPAVEQDPKLWWEATRELFRLLLAQIGAERVAALAVDGTSGTVLVADSTGHPLHSALMYNDGRALDEAVRIAAIAPKRSAAHGAGGGLAKLLWLLERSGNVARVHTQADWIAGRLLGRLGWCDANSALKLGWDPVERVWPDWLERLGVRKDLLPEVVFPATPQGTLAGTPGAGLGLPASAILVAGTTDSTAAFQATGVTTVGEAVTSLGSTLVTKVLSRSPVFAPEYGVYSQPLGDGWLVGGGSNTGGAVLRHFFSDARMALLERQLAPDTPTGLDYYPLLTPGERFPVSDPHLMPRLEPRPADDAVFFQALIEGMARIERRAYDRLAELGAPYPSVVWTAGGGSANPGWTRIRERLLGVPVRRADHTEAAYGTALLAIKGYAIETTGS